MKKKKQFLLYGTGNQKDFNHYTFEKTEEAYSILKQIFLDILKVKWPAGYEKENENGEMEFIRIPILERKDYHEFLGGFMNYAGKRVDVFYGDKKMFITIHCSLEDRKKINNLIKEKFVMPESKSLDGQTIKISKPENEDKKQKKTI